MLQVLSGTDLHSLAMYDAGISICKHANAFAHKACCGAKTMFSVEGRRITTFAASRAFRN